MYEIYKIIEDQVLRENIESQFQADFIDGHKLKESFIKSIPFFSFTGTGRIKNIEGIQYFSGLTFLNLANCSISDLSPYHN